MRSSGAMLIDVWAFVIVPKRLADIALLELAAWVIAFAVRRPSVSDKRQAPAFRIKRPEGLSIRGELDIPIVAETRQITDFRRPHGLPHGEGFSIAPVIQPLDCGTGGAPEIALLISTFFVARALVLAVLGRLGTTFALGLAQGMRAAASTRLSFKLTFGKETVHLSPAPLGWSGEG
ncbi:MAG: hypothetical protein WA840_20555 [Caulobacteraceae bacterium]